MNRSQPHRPVFYEPLPEKQTRVFTGSLLYALSFNQRYLSHVSLANIMQQQRALDIIELFHPLSITRAHQLLHDQFTSLQFVTQDFLVTASDDGFVKLFEVALPNLRLKSLLVCRQKKLQKLDDIYSNDRLVCAQFDAHMAVWDLGKAIYANQSLVESAYETDFKTLCYEGAKLKECEDTPNLTCFISGNRLIYQSDTQICLVDPIKKTCEIVFRYAFPDQKTIFKIGWSTYDTHRDIYCFSFCLDEY